MVHFKVLEFCLSVTQSSLRWLSALCYKNSKTSSATVSPTLSPHQTKLRGAQSATAKRIVLESSDWEVGSCLCRPCVMEGCVFSCCGLMRLCRVLRPHKQKSLSRENAKVPPRSSLPLQEMWVDKKQTQVEALASRPSQRSSPGQQTKKSAAETLTFLLYFTTN